MSVFNWYKDINKNLLNKKLEVKLLDSYQSKSVTPLSKFETSNDGNNSSSSDSDFCLKDGKYNTDFNKPIRYGKRQNRCKYFIYNL